MSNFTGVTFAQQKVLPSDDAIIRRASLSDGVLYGCEMSYSGSTLTMGSGQLLICGRQIRHPSAENWAIVDATSGFARLVLTVDLTKTSSKDSFEQVVDSIEYATSQDGFSELVREDVNVSGTRYQVAACVVSLGTGGITGIVNQLGPVEGGGLNFKVVPGMTQPGTATENTIWVKTDRINNYYFSATQPENMVDYDVWFPIDTSSPYTFSATKKNPVMVYPLSAKQYISGALVDKTTKSYQNGEWVDWWYGELYTFGNEWKSVTGGWQSRAWLDSANSIKVAVAPTLTKGESSMVIHLPTAAAGKLNCGAVEVKKDIDLTEWTSLEILYDYVSQTSDGTDIQIDAYLAVVDRAATYWRTNAGASKLMTSGIKGAPTSKTNQTATLDISTLEGKHDVIVGILSNHSVAALTVTAHKIKMHKG